MVFARVDDDVKSIGRETTLPEDITDIEKAKIILMELADDVGMTVRKQGKEGRTVHITLKYSDFHSVTRQMTLPATAVTKEIYQAGCRLLEQNWNKSHPVRLIGISVSGFYEDGSSEQLSLFDSMQGNVQAGKNKQIDEAMDKIRNKFGSEKITLATLVKKAKSPIKDE
jgi:DNA polymerase-4